MSETRMVKAEQSAVASKRFADKVISQYEAETGMKSDISEYQRTLAQHMFLKIDSSLKELEAKRVGNKAPFVWENVNMRKLALDTVNRVQLGLDALIPAHIYVIPYWSDNEKKYTLDLRVGYRGELFYRKEMTSEKVKDIRIELVYETDEFEAIMKDAEHDVETYTLHVTKPFDRGNIVGGIAYIVFEDQTMNKLVMLSEADMRKAESFSRSSDFWKRFPAEMRYKTLVHRAVAYLPIDPRKTNALAYMAVEDDENEAERGYREMPKPIEQETVEFVESDIVTDEGKETADEQPDF